MRVVRMLLALFLPAALTAQTVRGRVVSDAESPTPIARAIVELTQGSWSRRTLTTASGSFSLEGNGPGAYNLRVAAIGFTPTTRTRLVLGSDPLELGDFRLAPRVITLEEIDVQGNSSCKAGPNSTSVLGRLLDGARTSLEVMEATLPTMQGGFKVERVTRRAVAARRDSFVTADTLISTFSAWPIASVGLDSLERFGFSMDGLSDGSAGRTWFGPDVAVLFSDWFLAGHCFMVMAPKAKDQPIVITYEPATKRGMVDIGGELTLDPATLALTALTFEHRNLPNRMRNGVAGGELEFAQLPSGLWLPMRWSIRAPIQTTRGEVAGSSSQSGAVVGYEGKLPDAPLIRRRTARIEPFSVPRRVLGPPDSLGDVSHYQAAIDFACPSAPATRDELFRGEAIAAERAGRSPTDADAWHALACVRAHLDVDGAIGRESIEMPLGTSWQEGAINAELKALGVQRDRRESAELLAVLMSDQPEPKPASDIRAALARAVTAGVAAPAAVRGCASLSLRLGDLAASNRCLEIGLEGGTDSTWQLLMLARLASRTPDTAFVATLLDGALGSAHDAAAWSEVGWHLRWFLEPDEWDEWLALDDARRGGWVRDRLAARDIRDGKRAGARLVEHFHRLDYAEEHFRRILPRILRGFSQNAANPEGGTDWDGVRFTFIPEKVSAQPFRFYRPWQEELDDRGAIWIRFGKPDNLYRFVGGLRRESWLYTIDGTRLLLHFESEQYDGSNDPTRLVAGVVGLYLCGMDLPACAVAQRLACWELPNGCPGGQSPVTLEAMEQVRTENRHDIAEATTKDDNSLRVAHHIATVATHSRVWDPASGTTLAVVPYALRVGDLAVDPDSSTATIDLTVRQWNPIRTAWQETAITQRLRLPSSRDKDAYVTGYLVVPSTEGVSAWSLVAGQGTDRLGRPFADRVPPLGLGPLAISDIILGAASQGESWLTTGGRSVPLGPLGAYDRTRPVAVYWQTDSERARVKVRTTIRLLRTDRKGIDNVALEVATEGELAKGLTEVQREVGVAQLDPGAYRLEVELTDLGDH
ncbi:MAG TPA: carboxypeptidase regulatory-like domain-containing protein, partial [Gemmatimonadales bacterium]|nr:carboxypeptidase regulatory-like domain-containing protein [Gemmatimonadales bacterium]